MQSSQPGSAASQRLSGVAFIPPLRGGSLAYVRDKGTLFEKHYSGPLLRGHQKLELEHEWYKAVTSLAYGRYPNLFPQTFLGELDHESKSSLFIEKLPGVTITKLALQQQLSVPRAEIWFDIATHLLVDVIHPLRMSFGIDAPLEKHYWRRLELAEPSLRNTPELNFLFAEPDIYINGIKSPSLGRLIRLLTSTKSKSILSSSQQVAIHGNFHLDNILISHHGPPSPATVSFIDPRGDLLGPASYDIAKLMTTLHAYYDEIHYDHYLMSVSTVGMQTQVDLKISPAVNELYSRLLGRMKDMIGYYASMSRKSYDQFLHEIVIGELIHIISFTYYHLNRLDFQLSRVKAYCVVACLLGRSVESILDGTFSDSEFFDRRLEIAAP